MEWTAEGPLDWEQVEMSTTDASKTAADDDDDDDYYYDYNRPDSSSSSADISSDTVGEYCD